MKARPLSVPVQSYRPLTRKCARWTAWMEISTQTCYAVLNFWKASLLYKLFAGSELPLPESIPMRIAALVGLHLAVFISSAVVSMPLVIFTKSGFSEGKGKSA